MGVTVHYKLGQEKKYIKSTLDLAEVFAKKIKIEEADKLSIKFEINRFNPERLMISIGGCEDLLFDFKSIKLIQKEANDGWTYEKATLIDEKGIAIYGPNLLWASAFCKTQYASNIIEHKWVVDILKVIASRCRITDTADEGNYYHSGKLEKAIKAIQENGEMINDLGKQLEERFGKTGTIIKGGTTKIGNVKMDI